MDITKAHAKRPRERKFFTNDIFPRPLRAGLTYAAPPGLGLWRGGPEGTGHFEVQNLKAFEADRSLRFGMTGVFASSFEDCGFGAGTLLWGHGFRAVA